MGISGQVSAIVNPNPRVGESSISFTPLLWYWVSPLPTCFYGLYSEQLRLSSSGRTHTWVEPFIEIAVLAVLIFTTLLPIHFHSHLYEKDPHSQPDHPYHYSIRKWHHPGGYIGNCQTPTRLQLSFLVPSPRLVSNLQATVVSKLTRLITSVSCILITQMVLPIIFKALHVVIITENTTWI